MSVGFRLVITKIRNHRAISVDGVAAVGIEKVTILVIKRRRKSMFCCADTTFCVEI